MTLFLGIDGGQSSTAAVIGNEDGRVIGKGHSGPCNHVGASERRAKFFKAVGESVRVALRESRVDTDTRFAAVCAGFSGGAADKDALTRELIPADRYLITHDARIALTGATAGGPGIVTIAGTGSIAYGRDSSGKVARAGGWGYQFGDEGSAFDLVRQALRALLRHEEGWGPDTALREALLTATETGSAGELLHAFYTDAYPRERIAFLAYLIDEAARNGDPIARDLLGSAAQSLATITAAVRGQLFEKGSAVSVHYAGGVFTSELLLTRFRMLIELEDGCTVSPPRFDAARGALIEAYQLAGMAPQLR